MQLTILPFILLALSLGLSNLSGACAGGLAQLQSGAEDQSSKIILRIAERISEIANSLNYRSVRAYKLEPDEWDTDARLPLVVNYAFYSLFSRDPDSLSDSGPMHRGASSKRLSAIILVFKDADSAAKELLNLRKQLAADLGAKVVREGKDGFEVRAAIKSHIALRRGVSVVLLGTDKQEEAMSTIASKLRESSW